MYTTTLKEDLNSPVNQVQRAWIRRPVALLSTPLIILLGLSINKPYTILKMWLNDTWNCEYIPKFPYTMECHSNCSEQLWKIDVKNNKTIITVGCRFKMPFDTTIQTWNNHQCAIEYAKSAIVNMTNQGFEPKTPNS